MAGRLRFISELAAWTVREVTRDAEGWKRYLETASRLYKYSFEDQLLIYAQRPNATACAAMEIWNEKMHRWVRGGSKSIALLRRNENRGDYLEYVFDVADTRPVRGARMPYLWEMREEHHTQVLSALEERYGEMEGKDLGSCLMEAAAHAVEEVYRERFYDLADDTGRSFPGGPDGEAGFKDIFLASVQYVLLVRCGLKPSAYMDDGELRGITAFSAPAALHHLGDAVSTVSMEILLEVGKTIRRHDRESLINRQKNNEKPLGKMRDAEYTGITGEFNDLKRESEERSTDNGRADLHEERRISDPRPVGRRGGQGGDAPGQIWDVAPELSPEAPSRDIHLDAPDRTAHAAPASDRQAGAGAGGPDSGGDDGKGRGGRGPEGAGPDGLGTGSQQLHGAGGGSGAAGDRVQVDGESTESLKGTEAGLEKEGFCGGQEPEAEREKLHKERQETAGQDPAVSVSGSMPEQGEINLVGFSQLTLFPTVAGQMERIARAQETVQPETGHEPFGYLVPKTPEEAIDSALTCGGSEADSVLRIIAFFQKSPEDAETAAFLEKEYGTWGRGIRVSGKEYALWHDEVGIHIAPGHRARIPGSTLIPWREAGMRIRRLLREGRYASQEKLDGAWENKCLELAKNMWYMRHDISDEAQKKGFLPYLSNLCGDGFPKDTERIAEALQEEEGKAALAAELGEFAHAYETDKGLMRFQLHNPVRVAGELSDLGTRQEQFRAAEGFEAVKEGFITEDEADSILTAGLKTIDKKMEIYSYFMQGHGQGKCAAFLRRTYRDAGASTWHARCEISYDNKGMRIAAKDDLSGHDGYVTLQLDWKGVEERVRRLVDAGKYLSPEELAYTPEYEKKQLARQVYDFYFHDPNAPRKGERTWDTEAAERDYLPMLKDPKYKVVLYKDMVETFAAVPAEDTDSYQPMKAAMDAMGAFIRGEYSLFTHQPGAVSRKGRKGHSPAKKAQGEEIITGTTEGTDRSTEGEKAEKIAARGQGKREPAGELEAAARALDRKQKKGTRQEADGQLSFDFGSPDISGAEVAADQGKEAEKAPDGNKNPETGKTSDTEPAAEAHSGRMAEKEPGSYVEILQDKMPGMGSGTVPQNAPAALYREALTELIEQVMDGGFIAYLRDRGTSHDEAIEELDDELDHFINEIENSRPELYHAFQTFPKFREWMVEDILERTYQDVTVDPGDAVARHAGDPDAPEWVREAALSDLEEAKQLIDSFCRDVYDAEPMDFDNLEQVGLAWTVIEDEQHEIEVMAEANLLEPSISRLVDGICVERREYGSLRELINEELCALDYVELLRLDHIAPEVLLEAGIPEEQLPELLGTARQEDIGTLEVSGLQETGQQQGGQDAAQPETVSHEAVEIEGGQIVTAGPMEVYHTGLPYDIVVQKLHFGPELHNFRITDETLGTGGQKTKFQNNLAAIHTLKQIEAEKRMASPQEQETLSQYVGWGGLAQAFDPANEKWEKEYTELKEALTPEEYESARGSVLNAHYTSPTVISAVYEALGRMDFIPGNILEPSCGIGNFFGLLPEKYDHSSLYGVELDSLTGRIAGQLYQKARITVKGFEHTEFPNDFFDLAIGNVPFGEYKVHDRHYDRQNLLIHDYFLTKALDKVRPGGIMAFLTSKGTMDKANENVREVLAQKADLLGAIRLPNNAFLGNAGTSVTADILFFQKRGSAPEKIPDWVHTGQTEAGIPLNHYFLQHPEMVLGRMEFARNMYGNETETACLPFEGADIKDLLAEAVGGIAQPDRELLQMDAPRQNEQEGTEDIPADPHVRNFSFTERDGKLYFRENSRMKRMELGKMPAARVSGMIGIRDSARRLIDLQLNGAGDGEIAKEQAKLNVLYDDFQKKYGLINSVGNRQAFRQDVSYPLLSSLEVLDGEGNFKCKADMFSKRTICHRSPVNSVDTAVEALGVSVGERACVDIGFMASLMGGSEKIPQIVSDLKGIIFKEPATGPFDPGMQDDSWYKGWQAADEYLSGNVRRKLELAREAAEKHPEFAVNVEALEKVQPKDLSAPEISVRIGAPWVDTKYYRQFLFELLQVPEKLRHGKVDVLYAESTGEWGVKKDGAVSSTDTRVWNTYGTKRMNAYEIFDNTLNQRSVQIFDYKVSEDGRDIRVLNEKETAIAQQKQEAMKEVFQDWIFKDPERRKDLCGAYNRLFNSTRPREYDGQHIVFSGMNPEIRLETHQKNAVARILYGGNTLLAHVVGAGKTYEMAAAAMESKRLGLCRKSMIVVPNHLTEQWGSEFLTLYPGAKVLVATKKDFEPRNRKRFCARIATGDFDAVIIGHSQFEKIPLSSKRQEALIRAQIDDIVDDIAEAKAEKSERFTIKQMVRTKKSLEAKMQRLHDKKKDDTVTFEELGIDRLFVDEAHSFKNLYLHTKMRNVAGISQTDAQKSSDMFAKCRYMDEITGGRGIVFATGTPISNSMVELYTMMRYLQYDMLEEGLEDSTGQIRSLKHFDNWAATFGEQVTAVELKPEGTGFRLKTRFARFYNLPELMNCWKEVADIQTAEMLKLPVPEAEYVTIQTEPSAAQKEMVQELARRAETIRKEKLDPAVDNMLKVTSDGRKLALDQRIMNPLLPDDPGSKVNACVETVFRIWQERAEEKGAQLIFSDLSTPKGKKEEKKAVRQAGDGAQGIDLGGTQPNGEDPAGMTAEETAMESSVYEDIRKKLIARGVPAEEIAFIHSANTDARKAELFAKVRAGSVRVLLGSTQKMGAGTNVQTKLVASHDLDCPWRPADLEQRASRIVRRGNENSHVWIYRYVTKGTFDAYTWGLVEAKQKFIGQVMTGKSPVRSIEDVDATALSYAEVKMLATGDVRIKEKMDLDIQVTKLKMLKSNHLSQQYELQDRVRGYFPNKIKETQLYIDCLEADLPVLEAHPAKEDTFSMTVMGTIYTDRKEAGKAIVAACRLIDDPGKEIELGEYRGFPMKVMFTASKFKVTMKQHLTYTAELSDDIVGNIARINNALEKIPQSLEAHRENLVQLQREMENAKEEMEKPFPQEQELAEKSARLAELNTALDREEKDGGKDADEEREEKQETWADPGTRPSILKALKEYEPPAPARPGVGRGMEREAVG